MRIALKETDVSVSAMSVNSIFFEFSINSTQDDPKGPGLRYTYLEKRDFIHLSTLYIQDRCCDISWKALN